MDAADDGAGSDEILLLRELQEEIAALRAERDEWKADALRAVRENETLEAERIEPLRAERATAVARAEKAEFHYFVLKEAARQANRCLVERNPAAALGVLATVVGLLDKTEEGDG